MSQSARIETKERVDVEVETVEIELYECPLCEQQYRDEGVVPIGIGVDEDGQIDQRDVICTGCAESIWEYDPDPSYRDILFTNLENISAKAVGLVGVGVGFAGAGLSLAMFMTKELIRAFGVAAAKTSEGLAASGFGTASFEGAAQTVFEIAPLVVLLVMLMSLAAPIMGHGGGFK